MIIHW